MFYSDKEWLVLVNHDTYNFKDSQKAFKFYDKQKKKLQLHVLCMK